MSEMIVIPAAKKNESLTFYVTMPHPTDADIRVTNPTWAAGDARASGDGAAFANLATLPVVAPAGDVAVRVVLSAAEMNFDNVLVALTDQTAPEQWSAVTVVIHTYTVDADDLVRSTTPPNTLDVAATGEAGLDFANVKVAGAPTTLTNITVPTVTTLTGHTAQTGDAFARLGAPAGASVSADVAAVKVDTASNVTDLATLKTRVPDTVSLANINAEVDTALNTAIPGAPVADSVNQRVRSMDLLTEAAGAGDLAAILGDTNELQADWVNGGRLDLLIDAILADTGTDGCKLDLAQAYTEGQGARTVGGALECAEAIEANRLLDGGVGGVRTLYRSDGSTVLRARTHVSATELTP